MTREEAIKMLKSKMDGHTDTSYEWTETIRMAIKALEHVTPMKVNVEKWIYTKCPNNCGYELSTHHGDGYYSIDKKPTFCPKCGQKLDWEDAEV